MAQFRNGQITARIGSLELGITERRFRQLYASYLKACSESKEEQWHPEHSGGNRQTTLPKEVEELWEKMLGAAEPAPYGFAASEAFRRFKFSADRATVRRWAQRKGLAHPKVKKPKASFCRWQCQEVGALWQLDASPHRWFGQSGEQFPMIEMVDDCSRVITGARLYSRELLPAYLDLLSRAFNDSNAATYPGLRPPLRRRGAFKIPSSGGVSEWRGGFLDLLRNDISIVKCSKTFEQYGLPLSLYVDYHSFFFTHVPDNMTYLGWALHFYDISLKYAPTPQAKGKVERHHQFWQNRLPSYFLSESIRNKRSGGDLNVWPFLRRSDYERALEEHPYLKEK